MYTVESGSTASQMNGVKLAEEASGEALHPDPAESLRETDLNGDDDDVWGMPTEEDTSDIVPFDGILPSDPIELGLPTFDFSQEPLDDYVDSDKRVVLNDVEEVWVDWTDDPENVPVGAEVELVIEVFGSDGDGNEIVSWMFKPL